MKIATGREMAALDRLAAEEYGLPTSLLMENAGRRVAEAAAALLGDPRGRALLVVCGTGNNGGDGLVAARLLAGRGARVRTVVAARLGDLRPAARAALAAAQAAGLEVEAAPDPAALGAVAAGAPRFDLVVDALLGTGFAPPVRGLAAEAIALVNRLGAPVLAVDIPSGLSADHGRVEGPAVAATATVTLALAKPGLLLHPAASLVGRLWLGDIGFPPGIAERIPLAHHLATAPDLLPLARPREAQAHKGDFGHVLVVGGSRGMAGAPVLAARGALRAGAGLVTAALPASLAPAALPGLPEAMTLPLPEGPGGAVGTGAAAAVLGAIAGKRACALGPGLSRDPAAASLVRELLALLGTPAVVDADALNALGSRPELLRDARAGLVVTPHAGEMARLLGVGVPEVLADRVGAAAACAARSGAVVALKGARTVVAAPSGEVWVNPTGNPAMAAAGMGDVLTGAIAAHLARGMAPLPAALLGVWLHGRAGDLAAAARGPWGILAGETADCIPAALRALPEEAADAAPVAGGLSLLLP